MEADDSVQAHLALTQVWGVGPKFVTTLRKEHDIHSIQDLRDKGMHLLSTDQKLGLKHIDDWALRIPRPEVTLLEARVQKVAREHDPRLMVMVCG